MEKNNKSNILISVLCGVAVCFLCLGIVFLLPTKSKSNYSSNHTEIKVGDLGCTGCIAQCKNDYPSMSETQCRSSMCYSECGSGGTNNTYCCCDAARTSCSNSSTCLDPNVTVGLNMTGSECVAKGTGGSGGGDDPGEPAAPTSSCEITGMTRYNLLSNNETRDVFVNTSSCSGAVSITGSGGISVKKYSDTHFTITASGKCDSKGSYTVEVENASASQSVAIIGDWQERQNVTLSHMPAYSTKTAADINKGWEYGYNCVQSGDKVTCGQYGWRGCGEPGVAPTVDIPSIDEPTPEPTPTPVPPACYANASSLDNATDAKWTNDPPSGYYKISGITSELTCFPRKIATNCLPESITPPQDYSASNCEETMKFTTEISSKSCASSSENIYNIDCTIDVETEFNIDDNLKSHSFNIYSGQGFKFNIGTRQVVNCDATFNASSWLSAYEKVLNRMSAVSGGGKTARQVYASRNFSSYDSFVQNNLSDNEVKILAISLYKLAEALEKILDDYNNYKVTISTPNTSVTMQYATTGNKSYCYNFSEEINACEPSKTVKRTHSGFSAYGLTAPKDYHMREEKIITMYPESVSISKANGEVISSNGNTSTGVSNALEGGNKIYIDNNASAQTVSINVKVSDLSVNGASVSNDKCSLNIQRQGTLYRPIDATNPFINSTWNKGHNWVNSTFDFTKTIKADTWSGSGLYTINLSKSNVTELQTSNAKNSSSYLGLCNKTTDLDSITKSICESIK